MSSNIAEGEISYQHVTAESSLMEHHRFMLEQLLEHLALLEQQLAVFSARIEEELRPFVDDELLRQLDVIPGVAVGRRKTSVLLDAGR